VLDTVRAFFGDPEAGSELTGGPLLEWGELVEAGSTKSGKRLEHERVLESAEILELAESHAVVEVRAAQRGSLVRGSWEYEVRLDGPAVLEKLDGGWRIVDLTQDGRRRLASIVRGPLAEQQRPEATVRVLGVDRCTQTTQYLVELVNTGEHELSLDRAWALFETETSWTRLGRGRGDPIPPGESGTVLLGGHSAVELSDPVLGLALRLRAGRRKLPFLLKVPLVKPDELVPQRPPRYLPMLRSTWPRSLAFYAVLTAGFAWWMHELAVVVPVFVAGSLYVQIRTRDALPERLYRFRFVLDALVAAALFLVLWEVAPILAAPSAIAALVYLVFWRVARRRRELRLVAALMVGTAWLFLLGTYTGPLSPCRIADGSPASAADSFALSIRLCKQLKDYEGVVGCYQYRAPVGKERTAFTAGISCGGTSWRLDEWI
jgi:hypothetical protein